MANVLLFATVRRSAGTSQLRVDASTIHEAIDVVATQADGDFRALFEHCSVMLDGIRVSDLATPINDASELAILPPVSGGC